MPGLVDCHSHVALPGGAHWIDRGSDPPGRLLAYAEANGRLLTTAEVRRVVEAVHVRGAKATAHATNLERAEASVRMARAASVPACTGTDFGGGSARANQLAWEVEALVAAGFEPWEALGAATWRGGELLGEPTAGVIVEGGPADFLLVHGDPTSDPAALWRVWHVTWAA